MKKIHLLGLALVAVFAFGAMTSASAFASETSPEFLLNKEPITAETAVEITGEIELTDLKTLLGESKVLCSGILDGTILGAEPNHLEVTKVLTLAGTEIGSLASPTVSAECTNIVNCPTPLVFPINLNWLGLLVFMPSPAPWPFLLTLEPHEGGNPPGWEVVCMGVIGEPVDECTGVEKGGKWPGVLIENMAGGDLLAVFLNTELEEEKMLALCTQSNEESGHVNSDLEEGLIAPVGGGELEVS